MQLALDHLTLGDASPWRLVEVAADTGFSGCCLFLESMAVLPRLPTYSLLEDRAGRQRLRGQLQATGLSLDLVYPFTLSSRSNPQDFRAAMEAAADLQAKAINLLVYDRDEAHRIDQVGQVTDMAAAYGLRAVVEFYPGSAIGGLAAGVDLVRQIGHGNLSLNVDVLHLYRSGEADFTALAEAAPFIGFAQLADGPLEAPQDRVFEAACQRQLPLEGQFDLAGFARALPPHLTISLEAPDEAAIVAGISDVLRAEKGLGAARRWASRRV